MAESYAAWEESPIGRAVTRMEHDSLWRVIEAVARVNSRALVGACGNALDGAEVLDIGCGTGSWTHEMARRGARVTGLDAAPGMIRVAEEKLASRGFSEGARSQVSGVNQGGTGIPFDAPRGWGRVRFMVGDARVLPFPDQTFDMVTMVNMLEFVENPGGVLSEAARVTKQQGIIVTGFLNRWSLWALVRRVKGMYRETVYRKARFLTAGVMRRLYREAGLSLKEVRAALYTPPCLARLIISRAELMEGVFRFLLAWFPAFVAVGGRKL